MRKAAPPRTSLAQRGGTISLQGAPDGTEALRAALAASDSDETNDLTHGFHTYPARMHPRLARELIARFAAPGDVVLDPFCGSGTVLVEAMVADCRPQGVDLNPLALRISEVHCALRDPDARRRFERALVQVAAASEARVRSRARARIPLAREQSQVFQPHVLFELSGLWQEIESVPNEADRRALGIVFSSLLVKFSRQRADTSQDTVDKRIRKGLPTEFFVRKGQELALRWEALYDAAPRDAFEARLALGDARELPHVLGPRFAADLIVSSPPYGGTYDYADQHALRNAWFGLDVRELERAEIGARRSLSRGAGGLARWDEQLLAVLRAMHDVLAPGGRIILWMGDGEVSGQRVPVDEQVAALAPQAALTLEACAAQPRIDARGGRDRHERLLLLAPRA
jgi:SAM-dependent methyltransferase